MVNYVDKEGLMVVVWRPEFGVKGSHYRKAVARAVRALRLLDRLGVSATVTGSLVDGRFTERSDVDFLITMCPSNLKYAFEGRLEDVMRDIPFDVIYREELKQRYLTKMEDSQADAMQLLGMALQCTTLALLEKNQTKPRL